MERRRRDMFTFGDKARFWASDYGGALLLVAGLCLAAFVPCLSLLREAGGPRTLEEGRVLGFAAHESRWTRLPIVRVRTAEEEVREIVATRNKLRRCRRGDRILPVRRGLALLVHRQGCAGPFPEGGEKGKTLAKKLELPL